MAGNFGFDLDQRDIDSFLNTTIDSFIENRLLDKQKRTQQKEQCAERLAAEDGSSDKDEEVRYSDQAVLANLDWGIEALEEAIDTSNIETKLARLNHAEKMLQVCALLNYRDKTAGIPNFYLSAWAHLNLSYLCKLQGNLQNSVLHVLEMFSVDPFFSRIDFAPELWKQIFLPHMSSIIGWYSEEWHKLLMEVIPDSDLSFTADLEQFFHESLIFSLRPDQLEKLQKLEQIYGDSLDENTKLYAKYFKDRMDSDSTKKVSPMLPIAEPPMTPLREVSSSIPDFVKFGPILPKSAGFASIMKSKNEAREANRLEVNCLPKNPNNISRWDAKKDVLVEENEDESYYEPNACSEDLHDNTSHKSLSVSSLKMEEEQTETKTGACNAKNHAHYLTIFSPIDSPSTPSPNILSPKMEVRSRKEPSLLRLMSNRIADSNVSTSFHDSPHLRSHTSRIADSNVSTSFHDSPHLRSHSTSPADSDNEVIEVVMKNTRKKKHSGSKRMNFENVNRQAIENSSRSTWELEEGNQSHDQLSSSDSLAHRSRLPKDFVCPITGQIFCDPVTLETGQTYERKAIQEWVKRGNTTCPITRQPLSSNTLPKTNYVLKRLITSWKEQHPDLAHDNSPTNSLGVSCTNESPLASTPCTEFSSCPKTYEYLSQKSERLMQTTLSKSLTSGISQATIKTIIIELKPLVLCLCTSENLQECEAAVLDIARLLKESKADPVVHSFLAESTVVSGFVEILSASLDREVLRTSVYILSELISADKSVVESLTSVDSDFDCLTTLLKKGLAEAAVLICQLRPSFVQLFRHDLIPSLVQIILQKNEDLDDLQFVMEPKDGATELLEQILTGGDENSRSLNALAVISANAIPALIKSLNGETVRRSTVNILLCCMRADKSCRSVIAYRIESTPILELFHTGNDGERSVCVDFLSELVQLNRRTLCNNMLQKIRDGGAFSTMHALLLYLQMAPIEQQTSYASLLLQLDLLVEPRKMSIYREEAIDSLIESIQRKDFANSQMITLDALISLTGRFTPSGRSYTEAWLLKFAGFDQPYNSMMKAERLSGHDKDFVETMEEEEKALRIWEKRLCLVLCSHDKGSIFKALGKTLRSNSVELEKSSLLIATWLCHMLSFLPDIGTQETARKSFLHQLINVLQSSKNLEERILATLALKTFINDPAALEELGVHVKSIYKILRKIRRKAVVATDILKALITLPSVNVAELWQYTDVAELDSCINGEVLTLIHLKGFLLSGHSDGTIKVWGAGKRTLKLVQEAHQHTKAVTCLNASTSGDVVYSGSQDKTIRVWAVKHEEIQCIQVHDVKEAVLNLTANVNVACFISQGGVKVYSWNGLPKQINFNKYVKCLTMSEDKLYCGCSDSIQEVDLSTHTSTVFYAGIRKLLSKQTIYSLQIHDGHLYACGSSVDGIAGKIFSLSTKEVVGSFSTSIDIHNIAVTSDCVFTSTKSGIIELWQRDKFSKLNSIKKGGVGHAKITSLTTDSDGGLLFVGSSDGNIQVLALD